MNEIITRSLEEKESKWLAQFPPELMSETEAELVNHILDFTREYGVTPSVKAVMDKYEWFFPFKWSPSSWEEEPPPIKVVFDQTVERRVVEIAEQRMAEASAKIKREGKVPLEIFAEIERLHTLSLGVSRYSTFDRDLYFRRAAMNLPFKVIDTNMGGISKGDYMLIIGRLGTGKSTIAQWIAKHVWEDGGRILFISAEMLALDVFSRIDSMVGKFNPLELRLGRSEEMVDRLARTRGDVLLREGEIIIPRQRMITPAQIGGFARNLSVDLIVVDGAYLLQPSEGKFPSKWERVATVSNELKQLALTMNLPLIATAQIKRGADGSKTYTPEDIAMSDALGQDADFVLAVYPNPTIKERSELQLIKNRYGTTCATQIYTDYDTMTITDESVSGLVGAKELAADEISIEEWKKL